MSAGHFGGPKIKPVYIIILIVLVFALSLYGHYHYLGDDFNAWGVVYATILFFFLHHTDPVPHGLWITVSQYLAMLLILAGVLSFVYKNISTAFLLARIKRKYKGHVVIFGLTKLGKNICSELIKDGYKVIAIDLHEDSQYANMLRKKGAVVFSEKSVDRKLLDNVNLQQAATCILAADKDEANITLASSITAYRKTEEAGGVLKILLHVQNNNNIDLLKDYFDINNEDEHYDLETFNISHMAAGGLYDTYPIHEFLDKGDKDNEKAIAIIGYNATAEKFLVENLVLSHFPELENIKIYLVDEHAETHYHDFDFKYPFFREFVDLIPVKLRNATFFANFSWSKELIEKLSKVKAVYIFGDNDAALINTATSFRQFQYTQTRSLTQVPVMVCLPEDTGILDLLDATRTGDANVSKVFSTNLNISYFKMVSDTCTTGLLIEQKAITDRQAKLIHYFYTIKYGFSAILKPLVSEKSSEGLTDNLADAYITLPEQHAQVDEKLVEETIFAMLAKATGLSREQFQRHLSIDKVWHSLSTRKKESNRYAARHLPAKVYALKRIGCWPLNKENILRYYPRLAPLEHKRWSAEKMIFNFKYGPFPESRDEKQLLKEVLKIHNQLIPYEKLSEEEKMKDLNLFLLLPLLNALK